MKSTYPPAKPGALETGALKAAKADTSVSNPRYILSLSAARINTLSEPLYP